MWLRCVWIMGRSDTRRHANHPSNMILWGRCLFFTSIHQRPVNNCTRSWCLFCVRFAADLFRNDRRFAVAVLTAEVVVRLQNYAVGVSVDNWGTIGQIERRRWCFTSDPYRSGAQAADFIVRRRHHHWLRDWYSAQHLIQNVWMAEAKWSFARDCRAISKHGGLANLTSVTLALAKTISQRYEIRLKFSPKRAGGSERHLSDVFATK